MFIFLQAPYDCTEPLPSQEFFDTLRDASVLRLAGEVNAIIMLPEYIRTACSLRIFSCLDLDPIE